MREPTEMELRVAEAVDVEFARASAYARDTDTHVCLIPMVIARAAIRAMREPTPFMRTNAVMYVNDNEPAVSKAAVVTKHMTAIWQAMIDAASPPDSGEG